MITIITNVATLEQIIVERPLLVIELTAILDQYNWNPMDCTVTTK